jgi:hypothetical protein
MAARGKDGDHLRDLRERRSDASWRALAKLQLDTNVFRKPPVEAAKTTKGKDEALIPKRQRMAPGNSRAGLRATARIIVVSAVATSAL